MPPTTAPLVVLETVGSRNLPGLRGLILLRPNEAGPSRANSPFSPGPTRHLVVVRRAGACRGYVERRA
jgi:hypothetical protein